jgi:hypothetical protein
MLCSIDLNTKVTEQLEDRDLMADSAKIVERLQQFAGEADIAHPGALDDPSCHMTRMPDDLKDVRKRRILRHRVYYTGNHHLCHYVVVYIKPFKKSGTDDDDDKVFQKRLINLLATNQG